MKFPKKVVFIINGRVVTEKEVIEHLNNRIKAQQEFVSKQREGGRHV
jgi:uncharacterized protein YlzI (FlbEa/FlbD family)